MDTLPVALPRKRRRPPSACEQCRRRKVKCDQKSPCNQCIRSKSDACTYVPVQRRAIPSKKLRFELDRPTPSPTVTNPDSSASPQVGTNGIIPSSSTAPGTGTDAEDHAGNSDSRYALWNGSAPSDVQALKSRVLELEQKVSEVAASGSRHESFASHSQPWKPYPTLKGVFQKSRFFGQSHWISNVENFTYMNHLQQNIESGQYPDLSALFDKCKQLGKVIKAQQPYQPIPADIRDYVPPRHTSDILVRAYLRTFEKGLYRILHVPSFERDYEQYWVDPQAASTAFVIQLLLVLAIGTFFHPDPNYHPSLRATVSQWVYTAQSWLSFPFSEKSRLNITGLQIHCLLLLAREVTAISGDMIWVSAGSLLRTAMTLGLHRDPSHIPDVSTFEGELRRRLWTTILEMCLQSSIDAGASPLISFEDFDCGLPANINDSQISDFDDKKCTPIPKDSTVFTDTTMQISLMRTLPLRLKIAKALNDFRSDLPYENVISLGIELGKMCRTLHQHFESARKDMGRPTSFQVKLFEMFTQRFLVVLHQQYAIKARTNHIYHFSRKVCLESSKVLLYEPPQSLGDETADDDLDVQRLQLLGGGIFRNVPILAGSLVCLEAVTQLQEDLPSFGADSTSAVRQDLIKRIENHRDRCAERIRTSETNIKPYLFVCCQLAQIQALEAGTSIEDAMLQSFRTSLNHAHSYLLARAGGVASQQSANYTDEQAQAQPVTVFGVPFEATGQWEELDFGFDVGNPMMPWI